MIAPTAPTRAASAARTTSTGSGALDDRDDESRGVEHEAVAGAQHGAARQRGRRTRRRRRTAAGRAPSARSSQPSVDRVARDTPDASRPAARLDAERPRRDDRQRDLNDARASAADSEQKIALRQRQHVGRLARQQLAVGAHLVGLRVRPRSSAARRSAPDRACRCVRQPRTATGGRARPSSAPPSMPGLADEVHAAGVRARAP